MKRYINYIWGFFFVIMGIILGLNALEIVHVDIFFDGWWTLFIIVPCFINLFCDEDKFGNLIGLIIGICLLLGMQEIIDFQFLWKLIVPIILVIIGGSFFVKDAIYGKVRENIQKSKDDSHDGGEVYATFSQQKLDYSREEFYGGSFNAIFGEIQCDLKDAKIEKDVVIHATSVFGNITLFVPNDIRVKIVSTSVFGGVSDKRHVISKTSDVTIYLDVTCLFGGVDIK